MNAKSLALSALIFAAATNAEAGKVKIKLGTLAPEDTVWHQTALKVGERWAEVTKDVELKVYAGGVVGDEGDMVRKMRIGQLHAAMITGIGLGQISRSAIALQVPMLIESWDELDYVRGKIAPKLEKAIEEQGFVVLSWGDAGWVHQFSKTPAKTADDFRKLKMFVWAGDNEAEKAWRQAKFNVVPLSITEVAASLQTGLVDCFGTTPLYAMTSQWYKTAKHMVRINWSPLNGGIIVNKEQWEKIDPAIRPKLLEISREEGAKLNQQVRDLNDSSVKTMAERGLNVVEPDAATVAGWKAAAESAYSVIRGKVVPEEIFDEILALKKEYAATKKP